MVPVIVAGERDVRGTEHNGVEAYLGIPYAAAPVGALRQQPPAPPTPWTGDRDATKYGPTARKRGYPSPYDELLPEPHIEGDEYLNLNIWTPSRTGSLPVFVWIHGGAFVNGSGAVSVYDGSAFARDGVVCVTINYRLGVEGFLDPGEGVTNLGLRDQIAALEWVRDNIAGFGGDPSRVTIGGESAGGMSVACLLSSPKAKGLFRGAIMQSGAGHHAVTRENAKLITGELAKMLGVEPTREAIATVPIEQILDAQIEMSAEIQAMPDPAKWGEMVLSMMAFQPVVDGDVLPKLPIRSIEAGAGADVHVVIGANTDENLLFMAPSGALGVIDTDMLNGAAMGYGLSPEAVAILPREPSRRVLPARCSRPLRPTGCSGSPPSVSPRPGPRRRPTRTCTSSRGAARRATASSACVTPSRSRSRSTRSTPRRRPGSPVRRPRGCSPTRCTGRGCDSSPTATRAGTNTARLAPRCASTRNRRS